MNFCSIEVLIQEHHKHGIPIFLDVYLTEALTSLAVWKQATALDLQSPNSSVAALGRIVSRLAHWGQINAQDASGFVVGGFARDPKRPSSQLVILLGEFLCRS